MQQWELQAILVQSQEVSWNWFMTASVSSGAVHCSEWRWAVFVWKYQVYTLHCRQRIYGCSRTSYVFPRINIILTTKGQNFVNVFIWLTRIIYKIVFSKILDLFSKQLDVDGHGTMAAYNYLGFGDLDFFITREPGKREQRMPGILNDR